MKSFRNFILTYSKREYYANLWRRICQSDLSNTFIGAWNTPSHGNVGLLMVSLV